MADGGTAALSCLTTAADLPSTVGVSKVMTLTGQALAAEDGPSAAHPWRP
ncbi:MAG: hypothetical protein WBC95_10945 [Albidovulum sp.]